MSDAAVAEFSTQAKDLGDKIVDLTLKEAKELSDYLKEVHGIEAAAGGAVMMALPYYVLQATALNATSADVAVLLAAQTAGALASNALWGWWGDRFGKRHLLEGVTILRAIPPILVLVWTPIAAAGGVPALGGYAVAFLFLGALGNGFTIAMLGYLMEISPDDRRPAYSGYFNALVAPAALLPLLGAVIVDVVSLPAVFLASLGAAMLQYLIVRRLRPAPGQGIAV